MNKYINNHLVISQDDEEYDKLLKYLNKECKFKNPIYGTNIRMGFPIYGIPPTISCYEVDNKTNSIKIFRGNHNKLKKVFNFKFINQTVTKPIDKLFEFKDFFKPFEYQKRSIDEIIQNRRSQGVIYAACGSGKTILSMMLIEERKQKTLILVDSIKLMKQWESEIDKFSNYSKKDIGLFYGQKKEIKDITIALIQSANRHLDELSGNFGMVICDEVHKCTAETFQKTIHSFNCKYRYGLSGSLKRKDKKEFLIFQSIGDVISKVTEKDVEGDNQKIPYKVYVVKTNFKYNEESDNNDKRLKKVNAIKNSAKKKDNKKLLSQLEKRSNKFNYTEFIEQISKDKNRNKLIIKYIKKEAKKNKCIVFSDRVLHCKYLNFQLLKEDIQSMNIIGGSEKKLNVLDVFNFAKEKMVKNELDVIIGTSQCVNESMNIPILSVGFVTSPTANNEIKLKQQLGRIIRYQKDKKIAKLYYFWDSRVPKFEKSINNLKRVYGRDNVIIL